MANTTHRRLFSHIGPLQPSALVGTSLRKPDLVEGRRAAWLERTVRAGDDAGSADPRLEDADSETRATKSLRSRMSAARGEVCFVQIGVSKLITLVETITLFEQSRTETEHAACPRRTPFRNAELPLRCLRLAAVALLTPTPANLAYSPEPSLRSSASLYRSRRAAPTNSCALNPASAPTPPPPASGLTLLLPSPRVAPLLRRLQHRHGMNREEDRGEALREDRDGKVEDKILDSLAQLVDRRAEVP